MSTPDHEHVFRVATVRDSQGKALEGGRRCTCGIEVVGSGPFALNAQMIRSSQRINTALEGAVLALAEPARQINTAMVSAMQELTLRVEADRRRRFP